MISLHDDRLASFLDFEGFGLDREQQDYVKVLAIEAGYGAWASRPDDRERALAYLKGSIIATDDLKALASRLLELAAFDSDHEWEAPTLTGRPTEFAQNALEKLNAHNA